MNRSSTILVSALLTLVGCSDCGKEPIVITLDLGGDFAGDMNPSVFVDLGLPDFGECSPDRIDKPDPYYFDANCDGIDGDIADSVFVATYGDDLNPGTQALPKRTIASAIGAASTEGKGFVLVADGLHEGGFQLANGVGVAGGYGFGWERSSRFKTTIRGGNPAILGEGLASPTLLSGFAVEPTSEPSPGETVVTIYLANSPGVELRRLTIRGGVGGDGAKGTAGVDGIEGPAGGAGGRGREDGGLGCSSNDRPAVGTGGVAGCPDAAGGDGGSPAKGGGSGEAGADSPQGAKGGAAGPKSQPGGNGEDGGRGMNGNPGAGGDVTGRFNGTQWAGSSGERGEDGQDGIGGGGGGGGGGGNDFCDSYGGAGGGGGAGGCAGAGGGVGGHGGASVALFLAASDVEILECTIVGGIGGRGGAGGDGGAGGPGGLGGPGGDREDDSGGGGKGGNGGTGGRGGQGGAGAGGPSYAIFTTAPLSTPPLNSDVKRGEGGLGGIAASAAGKGADGESAPLKVGQ